MPNPLTAESSTPAESLMDNPELKRFKVEISKRFETYFNDKDKGEYINDYAKIMQFLEDKEKVKEQLKVLNENLKVRLWENLQVWKKPNDGTEDRSYLKKILTDELSTCEEGEDFNKGTDNWLEGNDEYKKKLKKFPKNLPSGAPTIMGGLGVDDFRYILFKNGYQFKDPGAYWEHGEFSHRIQWYVLSKAKDSKKLILKNKLIDLFREFADKNLVTEDKDKTLWDLVVDCLISGNKDHWLFKENCRSPDYLNTKVLEQLTGDSGYKLLASFVKNRNKKRELQKNKYIQDLEGKQKCAQIVINNYVQVIWLKRNDSQST